MAASIRWVCAHVVITLCLVVFLTPPASAQEYLKAPQAIRDILDTLPPPAVSVSPTRDYAAIVQTSPNPTIADLAQPMLRLAGHRINPQTNGPSRTPRILSIALTPLDKP